MPEVLLIAAPLLVLAVVLVLGFSGCGFEVYVPGTPELIFTARVPTTLTVTSGVTFSWTAPIAGTGTATVTAAVVEGTNNVFRHQISNPDGGGWLGSCEMTVQADGQIADAASRDNPFDLTDPEQDNVVLFETDGSPAAPPFRVVFRGLNPP